jgi:hypothetical protein
MKIQKLTGIFPFFFFGICPSAVVNVRQGQAEQLDKPA